MFYVDAASRYSRGDLHAPRFDDEAWQWLAASGQPIFRWSDDGCITAWSPEAERLLGWSAVEVAGRPAAEFGLHSHVDPDRDAATADVRDARTRDGPGLSVRCRRIAFPHGGGVTLLEDARDYSELQAAANDVERAFRGLFLEHPVAMVAIDHAGRIVSANPSTLTLLKTDAAELIGRPFYQFIVAAELPGIPDLFLRALTGERLAHRTRIADRDGEVIAVELVSIPVGIPNLIFASIVATSERDERSDDEERPIHEISALATAEGIDPEVRLQRMLDLGRAHLGMTNAFVGRIEEHELVVLAACGRGTMKAGARFGGSHPLVRNVFERSAPLVLDNLLVDDDTALPDELRRSRTYVAVAFAIGGERIGLLGFASPAPRPLGYRAEAVDFVAILGALVANTLDRDDTRAKLDALDSSDALTGLPNRNRYRTRLHEMVEGRHNQPFAMLSVDLDRFKEINDTRGHAHGDQLLAMVAARFRAAAEGRAFVARLGGDDFMMLVDGDEAAAVSLAETVLDDLRLPFIIDDVEYHVSASIGIALCPVHGCEPHSLGRYAELAMYHAKSLGRETYAFYHPQLEADLDLKTTLERNLRRAIADDAFVIYYQPLAVVRDARVCGLEALIRWNDPARGLVLPADFIPLAEESGLILAVGNLVLERACAQMSAWHERASSGLRLSINLSMRQFYQRDLCKQLEGILNRSGLAPSALEIELTESTAMSDPARAVEAMRHMRNLGVRLVVDDFGTGYSSLSYLKRLPIDGVKIDKSFINEILYDRDDATIVSSIIAMAHNLGLEVTAEGVENAEQLAFLSEHGCDVVQGFHVSRPLPAGDVEHFLSESLFR